MIPHSVRNALRLVAWIYIVSLFVHFLWEMLQSFAYEMRGIALNTVVVNHVRATLGDGLLMWLIYASAALLRRDTLWIRQPHRTDLMLMGLTGLILSVSIEWWALDTGRWSYTDWMPVIPGLPVGLLPVLQLILLPFPIFWAANRLATKPASQGKG